MTYQGNSIVDYLKSTGSASDFSSRTALATKSGIKGYSGASDQNTALLNTLNASATNPKDAYTASLTTGSTGSSSGTPTGTDTSGNAGSTPAPTDPFSSYRKYLSSYADSLKEDPDVTTARSNLVNIQNSEDQQSLDARKVYEDIIHTSGMLRGGAEKAGSVSNRNNSYILANLGVAESGASRKLSALTDSSKAKSDYLKTAADLSKPFQVGDNYYDPSTGALIPNTKTPAPFELSPGQARYTYNPKTGAYEETAKLAPLPKEPTKPTEAEKKQPMIDDVNSAVSQLGQIVKSKGFKGVSPDDYNTMRAYLQENYGYEGVAELDKALGVLGLSVDYKGK